MAILHIVASMVQQIWETQLTKVIEIVFSAHFTAWLMHIICYDWFYDDLRLNSC